MKINWSDEKWAYLLGVIHGDGSIAPRSITVCVGYKDAEYAEYLISVFRDLGCEPKVYRPRAAMSIQFHSAELQRQFAPFKKNGVWSIPDNLNSAAWLAGIIDTDGCVSLANRKCAVIITLKRSGNLYHAVSQLEKIGIPGASVKETNSTYGGKVYPIETLRLTSFTNILKFANAVKLRHPKKAARLQETKNYILQCQAHVPLWKEVGIWLEGEPRTWEEIATHFNLTKDQVDSVMQNLKRYAEVEVIPPPKTLYRYRVSGLSSSREE